MEGQITRWDDPLKTSWRYRRRSMGWVILAPNRPGASPRLPDQRIRFVISLQFIRLLNILTHSIQTGLARVVFRRKHPSFRWSDEIHGVCLFEFEWPERVGKSSQKSRKNCRLRFFFALTFPHPYPCYMLQSDPCW